VLSWIASVTRKQINHSDSNLAHELLDLQSKNQIHKHCLSLHAIKFLTFFNNNKGHSNEFVTWLI